MIFTKNTIKSALKPFLEKHKGLKIIEMNDNFVHLNGAILVNRIINGYTIYKEYIITIYIPINSNKLPYVIDTNNIIDPKYPHIYSNKELCLETDSYIRLYFIDGFDLNKWMDEFIEPYFISYEYYIDYGTFPNGERTHGIIGTLESYKDIFHTDNIQQVLKIMYYIKNHTYRGHHPCPCGSKKRIRKCHGKWILPFHKDIKRKSIMLDDLQLFETVLNLYKKQQYQKERVRLYASTKY